MKCSPCDFTMQWQSAAHTQQLHGQDDFCLHMVERDWWLHADTMHDICTYPVGDGCVYVTCRCTVGDGLLYMTVDMYMKSKWWFSRWTLKTEKWPELLINWWSAINLQVVCALAHAALFPFLTIVIWTVYQKKPNSNFKMSFSLGPKSGRKWMFLELTGMSDYQNTSS